MNIRALSKSALLLIASLLTVTGNGLQADDKKVTIITPETAHEKAQSGALKLIDIRRPEEWAATGIPSSGQAITMHGPDGVDGLIADITTLVDGDKNAPVAVICRSGNRSARVAAALSAKGFTNIYDVGEGMEGNSMKQGWLRRGLPIKTAP